MSPLMNVNAGGLELKVLLNHLHGHRADTFPYLTLVVAYKTE